MTALAPQRMQQIGTMPRRKHGWHPDGTWLNDPASARADLTNPASWGAFAAGAGGGAPPPAGGSRIGAGANSTDARWDSIINDPTGPNNAMRQLMTEGFRLRDEGEQRRTQTLGYLNAEQERASAPTLTDEDARTFMSRESDRITGESHQEQRDLGTFLGATGNFGGGMPTALAASLELKRMGQIVGARRDIKLEKARTDALDRAARFQRALPIGALMNEDPNTSGYDALLNTSDWRTQIHLGNLGVQAADRGAKASKDAGKMGMLGSIASGVLGLI